jgi:hypothetical protein
MSKLRLGIVAFVMFVACAAPNAEQRATDAELAALAPLKQTYPVLVGFDVRSPTLLVVSLDLQAYIGMSDDDTAALKRTVVERWRTAWMQSHPRSHGILRARFIDFIGRKVAEEATVVR